MLTPSARGESRILTLPEGPLLPELAIDKTPFAPNALMADWATVFASFLATGDSKYKASAMYFEFENVADPEDEVTPPVFTPTEGIEYYDGLSVSSVRDYLRVEMSLINVYSTDESQWPDGNAIHCYASSSGVTGVHGKEFSDSANSKLFGAALVVRRDPADATQDLVVNRIYYASASQRVKLPSTQLVVEWRVPFGV